MTRTTSRSYTHRHLDFSFEPVAGGARRLTVHSAEVMRGLFGGDRTATGYKTLGSVDLSHALADAIEDALRHLRTDLAPDLDPETEATDPPALRTRRAEQAERLEAFFIANTGNPLVANGVVVDPRSPRGKRLVQDIRDGRAEPALLRDWVRLRIEWRAIMELA